jgi:hypothetical protein
VVSFAINAFMSFKLIQSDLKNITSSIVFAFITTKIIKAQPIINQTKDIAVIKLITWLI